MSMRLLKPGAVIVTLLCCIFFLIPLAHAQVAPTATLDNASADLATLQTRLEDKRPIVWLFTGDSVTEGAKWLGGRRSYSEIFSGRMRWEMNRGRDVVVNTAISGNKTDDILTTLIGESGVSIPMWSA